MKTGYPKFPIGSKVYIAKDMPYEMAHFPSGMNAIVKGTYGEIYGGNEVDLYSLILLDENNKPFTNLSWYKEKQLTLISSDVESGRELITKYRLFNT